ncbi:MAG TPA: tRNA dihydrouridine synthase DusB [Firmicutes bacterium]|nr:tRNA dihydrouridine synthase DusB [Bacillota bacterium]
MSESGVKIGELLVDRVLCAPMAGVTDSAFRRIVRRFHGGLLFTEMLSAKALLQGNPNSFELMRFDPQEKPICAQLFGSVPEEMGAAAQLLEEQGFDAIDINMGCPVPKVMKTGAGCALLKKPKLAADIVKAISSSVRLPVSVKVRRGILLHDPPPVDFARGLQEAGASAITIHGRSWSQGYSGEVDLSSIARLKEALDIPVIGNGGIMRPADALRMMRETGCDGVMVARGMLGAPWFPGEVSKYLQGQSIELVRSPEERMKVAVEHLRLECELKGEERGVREMRKHACWYIKGFKNATEIRNQIMQVTRFEQMKRLLSAAAEQYEGVSG